MLEVSRASYYQWSRHTPSARAREEEALGERIERIHQHSRGTYGAPRFLAQLRLDGACVGARRVARLMRQRSLAGRCPLRLRRTTIPDPSSAFTISHTGAMTALAMLSAQLGDSPDGTILNNELSRLPDLVSSALQSEDAVKEWAADTSDVHRHYFTGWGPNCSTAYEVSLKMKEANYTTTEGLHLEQYLHGPFVSTDEGCQVTFVAPPATGKDRVVDVMGAVRAVGARTAAIVQAGDETRSLLVDTAITVPAVSELLSPIVYLVPLQLYTYWMALELGHNPDTFRLDDPLHMSAKEHYQL